MNEKKETEVLLFQNETTHQEATVVTDGVSFHTYTPLERLKHRSLSSAIAHLEVHGYRIIIN